MINIRNRIKGWKELQYLPDLGAAQVPDLLSHPRLILQVHDELLYEIPQKDLVVVERIIREEMETAMELLVPLKIKLLVGTTWGSLSEYRPP